MNRKQPFYIRFANLYDEDDDQLQREFYDEHKKEEETFEEFCNRMHDDYCEAKESN